MKQAIDLGHREAGSYRDPSGHVHIVDGRVFRTIKNKARSDYEFVRDSGLLRSLQQRRMVVETHEAEGNLFGGMEADVAHVLEHERIPWVSFPYEWTHSALQAAALLHLDIQIAALEHDVTLSDASAYNVQFIGAQPIFIDTLSFKRYRDGEFWVGHRQFCEQFLNPLLLSALLGVRHNAWYRGALEGVDTIELDRMLHFRHKLSWNVFSNVTLQARMQQRSLGTKTEQLAAMKQRKLPRRSYAGMLRGLRDWIATLAPRQTAESVWQNYSRDNTYSNEEAQLKHEVIQQFAARVRPRVAWDLGCNTGEYSETLLRGGSAYVVGIDFDMGALENAFARSSQGKMHLLPLFQDAANPSPDQGWRARERGSIESRGELDAIVALALEHHLVIGRNLPLFEVVDWLTSLAPHGIIEWVQKSDPTIQRMLALREDIFEDYHEQTFVAALERVARVVERTPVSASGRVLYTFDRPRAR